MIAVKLSIKQLIRIFAFATIIFGMDFTVAFANDIDGFRSYTWGMSTKQVKLAQRRTADRIVENNTDLTKKVNEIYNVQSLGLYLNNPKIGEARIFWVGLHFYDNKLTSILLFTPYEEKLAGEKTKIALLNYFTKKYGKFNKTENDRTDERYYWDFGKTSAFIEFSFDETNGKYFPNVYMQDNVLHENQVRFRNIVDARNKK